MQTNRGIRSRAQLLVFWPDIHYVLTSQDDPLYVLSNQDVGGQQACNVCLSVLTELKTKEPLSWE